MYTETRSRTTGQIAERQAVGQPSRKVHNSHIKISDIVKEVMMNPGDLSKTEEEKINHELQEAINNLITGCEKLDMEMAFKVFCRSPEFLMMDTGGTMCNYQTYLNNNINYLKTCANFTLIPYGNEIRILNRDMAIYSWAYRAEATLKTGEQDIIEKAGASFIFKKLNNEWKVVYYHESSLPVKKITNIKIS